jgi:hypothetical protein
MMTRVLAVHFRIDLVAQLLQTSLRACRYPQEEDRSEEAQEEEEVAWRLQHIIGSTSAAHHWQHICSTFARVQHNMGGTSSAGTWQGMRQEHEWASLGNLFSSSEQDTRMPGLASTGRL